MKKLVVTFLLCIIMHLSYGQSESLTTLFNDVNSTLNEYKFESQDINSWRDGPETTDNIRISLQSDYLYVNFHDNFKGLSDDQVMFFGHQQGKKEIKIPLKSIKLTWDYSRGDRGGYCICLSSDNGLEYIFNSKKDLLTEYCFCGSELTTKKLLNELTALISQAIKENFQGKLTFDSNK